MEPARRRGARPRIEDVAVRAGTSPITVSRALRDPSKVAPATRMRIEEAIEELRYIPNLSASSLASRRSGIVAVLVPTIGNSIFAETVQGIADAIGAAGLQLLLGDYGYSDARESTLVRALIGRQPEALVVVGVVRDPGLRRLLSGLAIPVVETWDLTSQPVDTVVGFSNEEAGAGMARHLLARGRRRLAFVGGEDERARARAAGFRAAVAEAGGSQPTEEITDVIGVAKGRQAMRRLLERAPDTDAVFFATDVLAVGALLECQRQGIPVPGRVAIAGLGDLEIGRELEPALTTVHVPSHEIGRRAGEIVVDRLTAREDGRGTRERIVDLGFTIIARESA